MWHENYRDRIDLLRFKLLSPSSLSPNQNSIPTSHHQNCSESLNYFQKDSFKRKILLFFISFRQSSNQTSYFINFFCKIIYVFNMEFMSTTWLSCREYFPDGAILYFHMEKWKPNFKTFPIPNLFIKMNFQHVYGSYSNF